MVDENLQLVVLDDDDTFIYLLRRLLIEDAVTLHHFTDPIRCLAFLNGKTQNYLMVDFRMPGMNGIEFLNKLKLQGFDSKASIILNSAAKLPENIAISLSPMPIELLTKDELLDLECLRGKLGLSDR